MSLFGTSPPDADSPATSKPSLFSDSLSGPTTSFSPSRGRKSASALFADDDNDEANDDSSANDVNSSPVAHHKNNVSTNGSASVLATRTTASAVEESSSDAWGLPAPRGTQRGSRANVVKTLLIGAEVPERYIDVFDELRASGEAHGAQEVTLTGARKILVEAQDLTADQYAAIWRIVVPAEVEASIDAETGMGRGEFNVLLALIGLAQEKEDVTLDSVDERRRQLPIPVLAPIPSLHTAAQNGALSATLHTQTQANATPKQTSSPLAARHGAHKSSFGEHDADPWANPSQPRAGDRTSGYGYDTVSESNTLDNSASSNYLRATSTITMATDASASKNGAVGAEIGSGTGGSGWATYNATSGSNFPPSDLDSGGFGAPGGDQGGEPPAQPSARPAGTSRVSHGVQETITVTALPEKEGVFLFQYRNYQVTSTRRNSTVVRRYSDFVWLLDCLHKRYPFRQLPLLPPKRVAINGNHLASDNLFIDKRRRGLARFANALVRHPVLVQEQLVVMFLTVPTELGVWRKQATIAVQEEFTGRSLPPTLEDSLPPTLEQTFETVQSGVRRSAEVYITLCTLFERLIKRKEGVSADYRRLSTGLQQLSEASTDTYHIDTNDVPLLNTGILASAKHLVTHQSLLDDEGRAWDEGVLEDLKRQRDCLVSMRELFDRRDRLARDNIPALEKRIATNEGKLSAVRAKPEGARKPNEAEKLEDAIMKDKQSIVEQHARGVFIKECVRDEILHFQGSQYDVSRLCQDWSQERVKYVELQADNWRAMSDELEGMPLGVDDR